MKIIILAALCMISINCLGSENSKTVRFEEADTNGDGIIQETEVQSMIDGFFIGTHDHGVMYIHGLIDLFYDQPEYK
jgi:hypothetical protein